LAEIWAGNWDLVPPFMTLFSLILQSGIPAMGFTSHSHAYMARKYASIFVSKQNDDDTIVTKFIDGSLITVFVVNCHLMTRNCKSWLAGRFTGTLIPVDRNQRMNVDLITHNHLRGQLKYFIFWRKIHLDTT